MKRIATRYGDRVRRTLVPSDYAVQGGRGFLMVQINTSSLRDLPTPRTGIFHNPLNLPLPLEKESSQALLLGSYVIYRGDMRLIPAIK